MPALDWSQCPAVESIPGKVSARWRHQERRAAQTGRARGLQRVSSRQQEHGNQQRLEGRLLRRSCSCADAEGAPTYCNNCSSTGSGTALSFRARSWNWRNE